jgi:oligopeptide/dipeptide ABC transporter ATP-binding protein
MPPARIVSGEIVFEGKDLLELKEARMREIRGNKIAMIFQEPRTAFNPVYTIGYQVCEVLHAHRKISKRDAQKICIETFAKVGIPSPEERFHSYPHQLSGGLCQRAMIAMALVLNPALLIADEATTALDVTIQEQILELLKRLRAEYRMAMLLISHDMGVIAKLADRVAVMYAGNIVETAETKEIFRNPRHPYTKALLNSIPRLGQNKPRLESIPGTVPSATDKPSGCAFHPRCPVREDRCISKVPVYRRTDSTRWVACHLE